MRLPPALLLAASLLASTPAHALLPVVQISNLSDFALGSWGMGDPAPSAHIDICIYALDVLSSGAYAITATGGNGFTLQNGAQQIPYSLTWDSGGAGNLGKSAGSGMSSGTKLTNLPNANTLVALCGVGQPTARLNLSIASSDMTAALAGTYTGTLTLTLSPN